ncbi:MAG: hypothetical protein WC302_01245 [Candidatus Paceibacterota bacterium]|jgi:hypothetical protein
MSYTEIYILLENIGAVLSNWWWAPLPFLLWKPFLFFYKFWREEIWDNAQKSIILEIKLPKEIEKPIRAMEHVLVGIHAAIYQPPDWWEKWIDGQYQTGVSFEIASIDGNVHFYVKALVSYREAIEASIYAQYPEAEISEAEDYTKYVPQNIPNKDWDLWGGDYFMLVDDHYPIKTYPQFETEMEKDDKRKVDPIATLMESMDKVVPGTQLWVQISGEPWAEGNLSAWVKEGQKLRDKIARRPDEEVKAKSIIREGAEILITGKVGEEKKEERELIPPEMKLTPGEREILSAIEKKLTKPCFKTNIRFIWLGKRDVWFKPNFRLAFAYFNGYNTVNLNSIYPFGDTLTKIHKSWFLPYNYLKPRRQYLRCRRLFRNYVRRWSANFPKKSPGRTQFIMNTEEIASLFHFPSKGAAPAPSVGRIESKRGGGPSILPTD